MVSQADSSSKEPTVSVTFETVLIRPPTHEEMMAMEQFAKLFDHESPPSRFFAIPPKLLISQAPAAESQSPESIPPQPE